MDGVWGKMMRHQLFMNRGRITREKDQHYISCQKAGFSWWNVSRSYMKCNSSKAFHTKNVRLTEHWCRMCYQFRDQLMCVSISHSRITHCLVVGHDRTALVPFPLSQWRNPITPLFLSWLEEKERTSLSTKLHVLRTLPDTLTHQ